MKSVLGSGAALSVRGLAWMAIGGLLAAAPSAGARHVEVRLIAHHRPTVLTGLTISGLRNRFLAQVAVAGNGLKMGQIIVLDYLHNGAGPPGIDQLLSWEGTWRIAAIRDPDCDAKAADLASVQITDSDSGSKKSQPALEILPAGRAVPIPEEGEFACYSFGPGDFHRVRVRR